MDQSDWAPGGYLEYAALLSLWEGGPLTARQVHERVGSPLDLLYKTTTATLDSLHAKGLVMRRKHGDRSEEHTSELQSR